MASTQHFPPPLTLQYYPLGGTDPIVVMGGLSYRF